MIKKISIYLILIVITLNITALMAQEDQPREDELAGIRLGFTTSQVQKILGIAPSVTEIESVTPDTKEIVWLYKERGIKVLFRNEKVTVIVITEPCNIATSRGLKIGDNWKKALEVYKYCSAYIQNTGNQIGLIFTLNNKIKLSAAIPSDREEINSISIWREE